MRSFLWPIALGLAVAPFFAACGGGGATSSDGGHDGGHDGDGGGAEALPAGWSAFDVTATLTIMPGPAAGSWADFPKTHAFTFVWDPVAAQAIAGAAGPVSTSSVTTDDGASFRTLDPLSLGVPFSTSCAGIATVSYDEVTFTFDGTLHGTARGHATYQTGDEIWTASVSATLEGVADATPPRLMPSAKTVSPLAPLSVDVSEPLPATVSATMRSTTSDDVVSLANLDDAVGDATGGFSKADVALRYGEVYQLDTKLVRDFAGLHPPADTPTVATTAAPPLAMQDGFESVATATFGGAGVLHGGPLTPIAGATSLILNTGFGGGFGFLPYELGPSLALRLAVAPGATVVRFTTQIVAVYDLPQVAFYGDIRVGAPGSAVAHLTNVEATDLVKVTLPRDGDVFIGPLKTLELPLPAGVQGEVTFEIAGVTGGCGLPPPPTALIIDDLRVE